MKSMMPKTVNDTYRPKEKKGDSLRPFFTVCVSSCFRQNPTCTRWQENDTGLVVQRFVGDLLEKLDGELLQLDSDQLERLSNTGPDYTMCNTNDN